MAALVPHKNTQYFSDEEKPRVIYEYIDKLIILLPDFDYFHLYKYDIELEPDFEERKKLSSIGGEIGRVMEKLGYIEHPPNGNAVHILTEKGRLVKTKGGHFKYLKSLEPKKDWYKIIPIVLSLAFGVSTVSIAIWNIKLNKDKSAIEKEQLNKQVDSLKEKIKVLESQRGLN
jgi:hypothetical protein